MLVIIHLILIGILFFKRCEILKLDVKKIAKTLDPKSTLVCKKIINKNWW